MKSVKTSVKLIHLFISSAMNNCWNYFHTYIDI